MLRIYLLGSLLLITAIGFACGSQNTNVSVSGGADSPTEAYKRLFAAVKSKDIEAIKKELTKKSIEFGAMAAQRNNTPIEKMYSNGFSATTFADSLPEMRDERIKDNMGALEVKNVKENKWEDLPFILEDGAWKLAVGDLFADSYKSPGRGRDSLEKEAANSAMPPPAPASNAVNAPIPVQKGPDLNKNMPPPMNANKK
ncbi:MAG: hypothetical protein ABIV21_08160 [Pyrinomonadaceae bacterium]